MRSMTKKLEGKFIHNGKYFSKELSFSDFIAIFDIL
ncbi:unknown [Prevotella sp. CAG:924]|nr:unknown [Prevotella sp. CAG:924]